MGGKRTAELQFDSDIRPVELEFGSTFATQL